MMIRYSTLMVLVSLLLSYAAPPAHAWGKTGHRVTGAVAEFYLSDEAKAAIADILTDEDLAEISTWPDFYRSSPEEFWRRTAGPFHYVTVPEGKNYSDVGAPPQGDAVSALEGFAKTLKDPDATREERLLALFFAVHIIGDLHQPLHVGNGTDRGGNQFTVVWFDKVTNLHSVWDTDLVDHEQLSFTEYTTWLVRKLNDDVVEAWSDPDPLVWVAESAEIRDTIYPEGADRRLRWDYFYAHRDTVRQRLAQGGVRMAAWFNEVFAEE
ncbi:MAG: S1/P1 nuclease [Pseudomonadota bacterium]